MTEVTKTDMANSAIMLNEAVTKRVGDAMLALLNGVGGVPTDSCQLPIYATATSGDESIDPWAAQDALVRAILSAIDMPLRTIIRQEIVDAFSDGGYANHIVTDGNTIQVKLGEVLVT